MMTQGGKTVVSFSKKVKFIHKKIHSTIQVHFAHKSSFIIFHFFQTDKGKYKAEDMVKLRLLVHDSFMRQIYLNLLKVKPGFILFFRPISSRLGYDAPKDSADDAGGSEDEVDGSGDEEDRSGDEGDGSKDEVDGSGDEVDGSKDEEDGSGDEGDGSKVEVEDEVDRSEENGSKDEVDGSGDEGSGEWGQHLEDIWISNGTIWVEVGQERVIISIKYVHSVGSTWPKSGPVES